jgi:hypothetical protein
MQVIKGNDVPLCTFTITDSNASPSVIPISSIDDIKINVYKKNENGAKSVLSIFRLTPQGTNGTINVIDDAGGKVGFVINRNMTLKFPVGKIYAEIDVQLPEGSEYLDSIAKFGDDGFEICEIIESSNAVSSI